MRGTAVRTEVGQLVVHPKCPGIAHIAHVEDGQTRLDLFESAACPVAEEMWVALDEVRRCVLGRQTRVFWRDHATGAWRAGRVVGGGPEEYFVRPPNSDVDVRVAESALRVRWDRPLADPLQVLVSGAQESPLYRDARLPMIRSLVEQRAACASMPAIPSSRVHLHAHQIETAAQILSDPIQRYMLADEVGLGKTIEAGFVIRQRLLDDRTSRIVVIAPDPLRRQWREEMLTKFFIDDFPAAEFKISAHDTPQRWQDYHGFDLVVIDEAHRLAGNGPHEQPYADLRALCHAAPRVLLLSATPVLQRETTQLGLLHLLDPGLYRWEDLDLFRQRLAVRRELARAVYALDADLPFLLPDTLGQIRSLLPVDPQLDVLGAALVQHLDAGGDLLATATAESLRRAVEAVRAHVGETYRLSRRVIRHRRSTVLDAGLDDEGLLPPFEVTGRQRPTLASLNSSEHRVTVRALEQWQSTVRNAVLDAGDARAGYADVLAVLATRTGGPADDLVAALRWRLTGREPDAARANLSAEERGVLTAAPVRPGESAILDALGSHDDIDAIQQMVAAVLTLSGGARTVLFAGPGSLATQIATALIDANVPGAVHLHTADAGAEASEAAVTSWNSRGGILVCDHTADDGRNLQRADLVVHLRLPANPNTLEQRLGRVDRYGNRAPARQVILGDSDPTLLGAWRDLLVDGYQAFTRSISALQDAVARDLDTVWDAAFDGGIDGLLGMQAVITANLDTELDALRELDVLESSYQITHAVRNLALDISRQETPVPQAHDSFLRLIDGDDGFRLSVGHSDAGRLDIVAAAGQPLMSERLLAHLREVPEQSRSGYLDRWLALRHGGRLFRVGNPLVDAIGRILNLDDRGRASAQWRVDPVWDADPLTYFGFVFLVEADIQSAATMAQTGDQRPASRPDPYGAPQRSQVETRAALRRRADRALAPFSRTVWIASDTETAVQDPRLTSWLESPYRRTATDINLSADRIYALHDLFGSEDGFIASATSAESAARTELAQITDLPGHINAAVAALRHEQAIFAAQAAARHAAGRLLDEDDTTTRDSTVAEALVHGIETPQIRLLAVTCLVRSRDRWAAHAR
jgi:ATP-dependent helicase HepA